MRNNRSFGQKAVSLVIWGIVTGGVVFILFLSRNTLLSLLAASSTDELTQRLRFQFIDKLFAIVGGIVALSFSVVFQAILTRALTWFDLIQETFLLIGIECITIGVLSLVSQIARRMLFQSLALGAWITLPLLLGGGLVVGAIAIKKRSCLTTTPSV